MAGGVTGGCEDRDAICDLLVTPDCVTLIAWSKRPCGIGVEAICFNGVDLGCLRLRSLLRRKGSGSARSGRSAGGC